MDEIALTVLPVTWQGPWAIRCLWRYARSAATRLATTTSVSRLVAGHIVLMKGGDNGIKPFTETDETVDSRQKRVNDVFHFFLGLYFPRRLAGVSGFSTFSHSGGLLALHRACLSALLYKSMKQVCFFRLGLTNVESENKVSKNPAEKNL